MAFELPTHALAAAETFVAIDPAASAGVCVAEIVERPAPGVGRPALSVTCQKSHIWHGLTLSWSEHRGNELATARAIVKRTTGPITLLAEAQFVGVNPSSTARIITSRARWCMAFEIACEEAGRPLTVHLVPPSTWQCEYFGLAPNAGSAAMKLASEISARHVLLRLTGQHSEITGDAADALCINMWALEHFLAGLPRKFRRPT